MKAIHVNWTAPFFHRERLRGHGDMSAPKKTEETYNIPDYQIFYTILSVLNWKKYNPDIPIKLYTDSIGLAFYSQFGIDKIYDEVDIKFLNGYSRTDIDPAYFWTSGKIRVLSNQKQPFVFFDQDLIIRSKLPQWVVGGHDLTITHWEIPGGYYYFTEKEWREQIKHIEYPEDFRVNDFSPNTSFLYINNLSLLNEYTEWHKKLVDIKGNHVPEWFWLVTDQGILGHIIRQGKYQTRTLTDKCFLANNNVGTQETRQYGISEPWYYPENPDLTKDEEIQWEHIWFQKTFYNFDTLYRIHETYRFFLEIKQLGRGDLIENGRFSKWWKAFYDEDTKSVLDGYYQRSKMDK